MNLLKDEDLISTKSNLNELKNLNEQITKKYQQQVKLFKKDNFYLSFNLKVNYLEENIAEFNRKEHFKNLKFLETNSELDLIKGNQFI